MPDTSNGTTGPIVVKIGGALIEELVDQPSFWQSIQTLRRQAPVVIVHGGGAQATAMTRALGNEPTVVQGRRVTAAQDLDAVLGAICGQVNTRLVAAAQKAGVPAVGLTGADGGLVQVSKRPPWTINGESVDFGFVGDIEEVRPEALEALLDVGFVPVIATLGIDAAGQVYNVNGDTVAAAIAEKLEARQFLLVTETGGVLEGTGEAATRLTRCDADTFERGKSEGWIAGGMQVKLHVAFQTLQAGIPDVFILAPDDLADQRNATQVVA